MLAVTDKSLRQKAGKVRSLICVANLARSRISASLSVSAHRRKTPWQLVSTATRMEKPCGSRRRSLLYALHSITHRRAAKDKVRGSGGMGGRGSAGGGKARWECRNITNEILADCQKDTFPYLFCVLQKFNSFLQFAKKILF